MGNLDANAAVADVGLPVRRLLPMAAFDRSCDMASGFRHRETTNQIA
jgi:hypothetical protein